MRKVEVIKTFKCTDGNLFEDHQSAEQHQQRLDIIECVEGWFNGPPAFSAEAFATALLANEVELAIILGWRES